jgi:hypothetical protein
VFLQLAIALRLHARNKLALLYSYLFPTLFLLAFWVLYRYEQVPLVRHLGQLLTVTILGGACFGLPTTVVSERERGVWRRYRLTPGPIREIVAATLLARYVLLIFAGALQLGLAMGLGMPLPSHPFDLWVAFTGATFAFLSLGLVIAMLANSVPAVQALGQCVFLPMLIVGGVAVPLGSLPAWAQQLSAFLPGRYAVEAIDAAVMGPGIGAVRFAVLALLVIGAAALLAAARLFRWDPRQRPQPSAGYGWVAVALASWVVVGAAGQSREQKATTAVGISREEREPPLPDPEARSPNPDARGPSLEPPSPEAPSPEPARSEARGPTPEARVEARDPAPSASAGKLRPEARKWQGVTRDDIKRDIVFGALPPDSGIVTPIAEPDEPVDPNQESLLEHLRKTLPVWKPAQVDDPVQRARNYLYVAGVADVQQLTLERHLPIVIFERLQAEIPRDELIKVLYWIAVHPDEGSLSALKELGPLRLDDQGVDHDEVRNRAAIYAAKLLQRVTSG